MTSRMSRSSMRAVFWAGVGALVVGTAACQRLDTGLTGGRRLVRNSGAGGLTGAAGDDTSGQGGTGGASVQADCPSLRTQAYDVLQLNCAICHQAPGTPALYIGSFTFILDLAELTSRVSPQTLKYVVKGDPGHSFIYQRITNNSMPPVERTQRPSASDITVLNQWITSCIGDPTSPQGWMPSLSHPDAGPTDAGPMLESCSAVKPCASGGCCVFGVCRSNGTSCGELPNPIQGQQPLPGLPGTCNAGSCLNTAGSSCGKVGQSCCDSNTCTAAQSSCLITDMTKCSQCGGTGEPCCRTSLCLGGHSCIGDGVGRVGTCELCGGLGQHCCGSGVVALLTCGDDLVCVGDNPETALCAAKGADGGGGG